MEKINTFSQVHQNDIHGMGWIAAGRCFYSGSKHNTVKLWDLNSSTQSIEAINTLGSRGGNSSWITALDMTRDGDLIAGTRNGKINKFSNILEASPIRETLHLPNKGTGDIKCKERNMSRVTMLQSLHHFTFTEAAGFSQYVLVGRPTELWCMDTSTACPITVKWKANIHSNDWIYCTLPLHAEVSSCHSIIHTLIVIGSNLSTITLNMPSENEERIRSPILSRRTIWEEDRRTVAVGASRAHIAHIEQLEKTNNSLISAACFDSALRVFDVESHNLVTTLRSNREKNNRFWQSLEVQPHILASAADDGFVSVWDIRTGKLEARSSQHEGRVSCLLWDDNSQLLLTASCPNHPSESVDKGCFTLFDMRY